MACDGKEGHLSSALSCTDLLVVLFEEWLQCDPRQPKSPSRDRFFFSKGHACTALYAVLAEHGFIPRIWLERYAQTGSPLPNHPCTHALPVLECSSGSLGHGLGIATGVHYGLNLDGVRSRVVALLSDGECNEGSVWEAAMFAAAQKMGRLLVIVDNNGIQAVGRSDVIMGHTRLEDKFRAFGWGVQVINGNAVSEIRRALHDFPFEQDRPSAIIAKTKGGAGVSFMEDQVLWHYRVPSQAEVLQALTELGERPIHKE
jgi:transketolase